MVGRQAPGERLCKSAGKQGRKKRRPSSFQPGSPCALRKQSRLIIAIIRSAKAMADAATVISKRRPPVLSCLLVATAGLRSKQATVFPPSTNQHRVRCPGLPATGEHVVFAAAEEERRGVEDGSGGTRQRERVGGVGEEPAVALLLCWAGRCASLLVL